MRWKTVVFEETGEEREVLRVCMVCSLKSSYDGCTVISPTGIAHVGVDDGMTSCGRDAKGDGWWWPT